MALTQHLKRICVLFVRRDIPRLLDPSVWGSQEEDPDWHFHYETGIYLERVGGKLYSRPDSVKNWTEVGDILKDVILEAVSSPMGTMGLWDHVGEGRPRQIPGEQSGPEDQEDAQYSQEEWIAAPEDPEWLFNSQSGIYFHRRDARPLH